MFGYFLMVLASLSLYESTENNYGSKEEETRGSKKVVCHDGMLAEGHINV